jgi:hypothetical protein
MNNDSFNKIKDINVNPLSLFSSNVKPQKIKLKRTDIYHKPKVNNDDIYHLIFNHLGYFS